MSNMGVTLLTHLSNPQGCWEDYKVRTYKVLRTATGTQRSARVFALTVVALVTINSFKGSPIYIEANGRSGKVSLRQ